MSKEIILNTSPEAARHVDNLSGWVSRHGRFYGDDEKLARFDGCTHVACSVCGQPTERHWLLCSDCRDKKDRERFKAREVKPYEGQPLFSNTHDKFFFELEDLFDYCHDEELTPADLELVICDSVKARPIDPNDYYADDLPEDVEEVSDTLQEAFDQLNKAIQKEPPLSWIPGKYAVDINTLKKDKCDVTETMPSGEKVCPECSGTGKLYHGPDDDCYTTCKACNGSGKVTT